MGKIRYFHILYDRHVEHRGVRSKLKTHAQPYHGGDGCKAEPPNLYLQGLRLSRPIAFHGKPSLSKNQETSKKPKIKLALYQP